MASVIGDRVAVLNAQLKEARTLFGSSNVPRSQGANTTEPRLEPDYARKLLDYWIADGVSVFNSLSFGSKVFGETSIRTDYFRNLDEMRESRRKISGSFIGDALLRQIWDRVRKAAITAFAIESSPTPWELVKESIQEAIDELPQTLVNLPIIGDVLKLAGWTLAAVVVFQVIDD